MSTPSPAAIPETKEENEQIWRALREAATIKHDRVSIINSDPGSKSFMMWFVISCYFPVITACLGPVANTISIACVVDKWRATNKTDPNGIGSQHTVRDPTGIFIVNILSLVIGFSSNIVLFLHFARKLSYLKSQIINITGWTIAGGMMLVDVIVCATRDKPDDLFKTIGFWFACITSGLYFGCTLTLSLHYLGYTLNKYPATFNLLPNERSIMVFTVFFSLWLIWGAAMFQGLLDISYGNALYFCTVSLLTVGFGDILASSVASKIMILIFSLSGVIILGLIVYMTRAIIQKSSGPIFYFHRVENSRHKIWDKLCKGEESLTNKEAFELMKSIKKSSKLKGHLYSLVSTIFVFTSFWLLGAVVFKYAEGWSYFNCIYFCFLCLLTIGYGSDYSPKTGAGRAFFVIWALGAVPLMGAILSTVGDLLFDLSSSLDIKIGAKFDRSIRYIYFNGKMRFNSLWLTPEEQIIDTDEDISNDAGSNTNLDSFEEIKDDNESNLNANSVADQKNQKRPRKLSEVIPPFESLFTEMSSIDDIERIVSLEHSRRESKFRKIQLLFKSMKKLHALSLSDKQYALSYEQWNNLHTLYTANHKVTPLEEQYFWLSDKSPLRFPINQPHFAYLRLSKKVDELLDSLIEEEFDTIKQVKERRDSSTIPQLDDNK